MTGHLTDDHEGKVLGSNIVNIYIYRRLSRGALSHVVEPKLDSILSVFPTLLRSPSLSKAFSTSTKEKRSRYRS